ncbi:hypothetical protein BEE62_06840 [Marinobacter nauticus]|uniref:Uncharacterized protein n=1 Tax=Marinobacter nauticus TaxID=2743 RepID=A0A1M2UWU5_MARNT|nr:hypothetical protein BEE62_06840 [Marinobacter nauticus]
MLKSAARAPYATPNISDADRKPVISAAGDPPTNAEPVKAVASRALTLVRPSDRLRLLIEHRNAFNVPPVFTYSDIKHWFEDMSDTALRVMVNRQCQKGDVISVVCHGVYQVSNLDWSSREILVAAALKLRGERNVYLSLHSALPEYDKRPDLLVCVTSGRNFILRSEKHGVVAIKHTSAALAKIRDSMVWDARLRCLKADRQLAVADYHRHHQGLRSLLREAGIPDDLPDISAAGNT